MHSFELYMPTRLVYGADSIEALAAAAAPYGKRALITYGGGSVVRSGLLDRVQKALTGLKWWVLRHRTQSSRDLCQRRSQTGP